MGRGPGEAAPHVAVNDDGIVEAAGGVVTRPGPRGGEVLVVHRPKYDDWSLPKGKLDPGETARDGRRPGGRGGDGLDLRARSRSCTTVRYQDRNGRPKRVRYWTHDGRFGPPVRAERRSRSTSVWISLSEAATLLSYDADRRLLAANSESR